MTETTFTDDVIIDGSQDIEQLRVQGHTTQNDPLQTWENNAGHVLAQVAGDGRLIVGDDDGTPNSLIEAHQLDTSLTKPNRGFHSSGMVSTSLDTLQQWIVGELELTGSDAIEALQTAFRIRAANLNIGTPTSGAELRGADIGVSNDAGSGPLTKATGLQIGMSNASGKTITDAIGLKVKMDNEGTITNLYAIYTEGEGPVHLEDYLELKCLEEAPATPPTGFVLVYPTSDGKLYAKNWDGTEFDLTGGGGGAVTSVNSQTGDVVLDTDDIAEGSTNLYYTDARFDIALAAKDTDDLAEGSNLYFTNARADARISAQKGAANGLATLGSDSKVPASQLPAIAITDVFVVSSEAAMLALTAERGDVAVRTDLDKSFILVNETPDTLSNWQEILAPGLSTVLSVNSQTGAVVLDTDDIAEGSTNQYYTDERVDDRVAALLTAGANINLSYADVGNALTVSVTGLTAADISNFSEAVDDRVNDLFVAGSNISFTYDDVGNTFTISFTGTLATTILTGLLQAAQFPALTGDVTTVAGAVATTLATVNSNVGSFAAADITVNGKGLITAAASAAASGTGNLVRTTAPTISNPAITGGSIDNTPIGATTPSTGYFSALWAKIGGFFGKFVHSNTADRTYTFPDYDGTVATLAGAETFTNKTLTSPVINTGVSGSAVDDDTTLAANSPTIIPTQHAVKEYIDLNTPSIRTVDVSTESGSLPANTYSNGSSGVGATITLNSILSLTIDGVFLFIGMRVLVMSESDFSHNGVYIVTAGNTSTIPWVFTRATDCDHPAQFVNATYLVTRGGSHVKEVYVCSCTTAPTIGTTSISFAPISVASGLNLGVGLTRTNSTNSIAVSSAVVLTTGTQSVSGKNITLSTIDSTNIGFTTPSTGVFTALSLLISTFKAIFTHANTANRTYTFPDYNGTIATQAGTETFTNKTLTTPAIAGSTFTGVNDFHAGSMIIPEDQGTLSTAEIDWDTTLAAAFIGDSQRNRALSAMGWTAWAYHSAMQWSTNVAGANITLAANGGTLVFPITVPSHMLLSSINIGFGDTTLARSYGWAIFDMPFNNGNSGENTLPLKVAISANDSYTAAATGLRATVPSTDPFYLAPGTYMMAVQNRHASNTLAVQTFAQGVYTGQTVAKTKTLTNPFGSSIDIVTATWTAQTVIPAVRLKGRIAGMTSVWG